MPPARARGRAASRQTAGNRRCERRSRRETSSFPRRSTPWEASRSPPPGRNRTARRRSDRHSAPSATPSSGSRQLWHRRTMLSPLWFRLCRLRVHSNAPCERARKSRRQAPRAHQPLAPIEDRSVGTLPPSEVGEIQLDLVTARATPDDQPQLGLRSTTERHWRAGGRLSSVRKLRVPPGSADYVRLGVHRRGHGVAVTGPRARDVEGWRSPTESSTAPGAPRPYAGLRTSPPPRAEARYGPPRRQLGVNHQPFWAKATEGAAPAWVRRVEPHNNAASHRHNANDLTTGLWLPANANAAPDKENIEGRVVAVLLSETQRD